MSVRAGDDEDLAVGKDTIDVEDEDFDIFCAVFSGHLTMIPWLPDGGIAGLFSPATVAGEEAVLAGQTLPGVKPQALQNDSLEESFARCSRRVRGEAFFAGDLSHSLHRGCNYMHIEEAWAKICKRDNGCKCAFALPAAIVFQSLLFLVRAVVRRAGC
jgi:hypothetical protein